MSHYKTRKAIGASRAFVADHLTKCCKINGIKLMLASSGRQNISTIDPRI